MTTCQNIQSFLGVKRIAVAGVSRNSKDFTRAIFRELMKCGYDAVPVNPNADEIEGVKCSARVADISPPVEGALLLTSPAATVPVVRECVRAGIQRIWIYRSASNGAVREAVGFCEQKDIPVIAGECPFMFLPGAAWPHRAHGFCRKVLGTYPR